MRVNATITVDKPRDEVYAAWRDFDNFPAFMAHVESVETTSPLQSHWKVAAPAGRSVEWDAAIFDDKPGELIAWTSLEGAGVRNSGVVGFADAPGDRGTEIILQLDYDAPGGALGAALAKVFGEEPRQQVKDDLRRFKQLLETGEVVLSEGSPEGQTARRQLKQRAAQPAEPTN